MNPRIRVDSRRTHAIGTIVVCAALALSACGDDDTDGAAQQSAGATAAVATTTDAVATTTPAPSSTAPQAASTTTDDTGESPETTAETAAPATSSPSATTATRQAGDEPAVCQPFFQVSAAFAGEPDPTVIEALLDEIDATAPGEIGDELGVLTSGARTVVTTGDFSAFESPEFGDAIGTAEGWMAENCAFATRTEIVAADYRYEGRAESYPTGRAAFTLVNDGAEAHEILLLRKNDGVELSLEELLELPETEAETMTTHVGGAFVGPPGARADLVVDLESGEYIAVCTIPVGTFVADDGTVTEGDGVPHVMVGMSFEFTVS